MQLMNNRELFEAIAQLTTDERVHASLEALMVEVTTSRSAKLDALLEAARSDGRLRRVRDDNGNPIDGPIELRLRRTAATDGLDQVEAELAQMTPSIPIGRRIVNPGDPEPPRHSVSGGTLAAATHNVAAQLGLDVHSIAAQMVRDEQKGER